MWDEVRLSYQTTKADVQRARKIYDDAKNYNDLMIGNISVSILTSFDNWTEGEGMKITLPKNANPATYKVDLKMKFGGNSVGDDNNIGALPEYELFRMVPPGVHYYAISICKGRWHYDPSAKRISKAMMLATAENMTFPLGSDGKPDTSFLPDFLNVLEVEPRDSLTEAKEVSGFPSEPNGNVIFSGRICQKSLPRLKNLAVSIKTVKVWTIRDSVVSKELHEHDRHHLMSCHLQDWQTYRFVKKFVKDASTSSEIEAILRQNYCVLQDIYLEYCCKYSSELFFMGSGAYSEFLSSCEILDKIGTQSDPSVLKDDFLVPPISVPVVPVTPISNRGRPSLILSAPLPTNSANAESLISPISVPVVPVTPISNRGRPSLILSAPLPTNSANAETLISPISVPVVPVTPISNRGRPSLILSAPLPTNSANAESLIRNKRLTLFPAQRQNNKGSVSIGFNVCDSSTEISANSSWPIVPIGDVSEFKANKPTSSRPSDVKFERKGSAVKPSNKFKSAAAAVSAIHKLIDGNSKKQVSTMQYNGCTRTEADMIFISNVLSGPKHELNSKRSLCRFQFIDSIFSIADAKFLKTKICKTMSQAFQKLLLEHVLPFAERDDALKFRDTFLLKEIVDDALRDNLKILMKVYRKFSGLENTPNDKKTMSHGEWCSLFDLAGISGHYPVITERMKDLAFCRSKSPRANQFEETLMIKRVSREK
jgi:hypothetical protein